MSLNEIIIRDSCCFVCGCTLEPNSRSIMDSTCFSDKPIYKFIESFVGSKFDHITSTNAGICEECLKQLQEYEKICRRAARIQEHISSIFRQTQENFKRPAEPVTCSTCFSRFDSKDEMGAHECIKDDSDVDEVISYIEYVCDETEDDGDENQQKGRRKKSEILCYTCSTCNKSFEKKREYSHHVKLAHLPDNAKVYTCDICEDSYESVFPTELELKFHNIIKHPVVKDAALKCPGCTKTFSNKSLLTRHFGLHLQDKPLVCDLCGKRYFHSSSFHMHMVAHKGIKDHTCKECGRSFISTSHLNRHLKTHSGIKNHECLECGLKFAQRYNLRAHMNVHFGISRKKKPKVQQSEEYVDC